MFRTHAYGWGLDDPNRSGAFSALQVKHRNGSDAPTRRRGYVWGGREGYYTLLNNRMSGQEDGTAVGSCRWSPSISTRSG